MKLSSFAAAAAALLACAPASAQAVKAPSLEAYGSLPAMSQVTISPAGDRVAMLFRKGDQTAYVVRALAGDKQLLQSIGIKDSRPGGVLWADNDHLFVSLHRTTNRAYGDLQTETAVVYLVNLRSGKSTVLAPSDMYQVRGGPLLSFQKGGHSYAIVSGGKGLEQLDLDTLQEVSVLTRRENEGGYVLDPAGQVVARTERTDYGRRWRVLSGPNGDQVLARGEGDVGGGGVVGLGRTPDTVVVVSSEDGDFGASREVSLKTGKASDPLVDGVAAVPLFDPRTKLLKAFLTGGESRQVEFLDPQLQRKWNGVVAAFPDENVVLASSSDDYNRWIVSVDGPHDPGRYMLVDLAKRIAVPLGAPYPDVPAASVGDFGWFDYKAADGQPLRAVLTLPPGHTRATARGLPVVVMPHGGPAAEDTANFNWWAQAFASRGYAVLQPNYRGSTGRGAKFERAGWGQWGKLMQSDVSDGLKALAASGVVDRNRACIVGWSYGGYAALAGITVEHGLYRCAAAGAAPADLNAMLVYERVRGGDRGTAVRYWKKSMALKGEGDPAGALVSPARLAAKADAPLLVIHGRDDTTVPYSQAQKMVSAMRAAGKPVELVTLDAETHQLESGKTRIAMLKAMSAFIERYNPPGQRAAGS